MKTEKDFNPQADRIINGIQIRLHQTIDSTKVRDDLHKYLTLELLVSYLQGVQDEAQRILDTNAIISRNQDEQELDHFNL